MSSARSRRSTASRCANDVSCEANQRWPRTTTWMQYCCAVSLKTRADMLPSQARTLMSTSACVICVCCFLYFALDGDIEWLRVFSTQQPTTRVVLQALARDEASEGSNLGRKFGIATRAGRTQCGWSAKGLTRMTSLCKLTPSCAQIGELDSTCGGVRVGRQNGWPVPYTLLITMRMSGRP